MKMHVVHSVIPIFFVFGLIFFHNNSAYAACSNPAGAAGDVIYNDDECVMQYCNDTNWMRMGHSTCITPTGTCTNPAGSEGDMIFNDDHNVMQFCNGSGWIAMGPIDAPGTGGCTVPAGGSGDMIYNDDEDVMQYCSGANWYSIEGIEEVCVSDSPASFNFTDQTDVPNSGFTNSNILQITGLTCPATVSITGDGTPQFRICNNSSCSSVDHNWSAADGSIDNNQYLQLYLWNSTSYSTTHTATVTVHDVSDSWNVTTEAAPTPFSGKRVFVTSTQYSTNLGGVAGADSICQTRATAAGLSGTFKAWIADGNDSSAPATRFTHASVPYGLTGTYGPQIADNWADLIDGTLDNPINLDEFGSSVAFGNVLTNVSINGTRKGGDHCSAWSSTSSSFKSVTGSVSNTNSWWTDQGFSSFCSFSTNKRLFCFEQ